MLRITVELVPRGVESLKRTLGTMRIINDGTGSSVKGNYDIAQVSKPDERGLGRVVKRARVEGHYRSNVSVWKLVASALRNLGHEGK